MLVGPSCQTSTPSSTSLALPYIYILNTYMEKYKAFVALFLLRGTDADTLYHVHHEYKPTDDGLSVAAVREAPTRRWTYRRPLSALRVIRRPCSSKYKRSR